MKYTHENRWYTRSVPLEHARGEKSLVCIGLKAGFKITQDLSEI